MGRVSLGDVENVLKLNCGDGCITVNIPKKIKLYTRMNGVICKLYFCKAILLMDHIIQL